VYAELSSGLDRSRWEPIAVLPERDWLWEELERRGIEPVRLAGTRSFDLPYLWRLRALARARRADLLQTHLLGSAVYGAAVGRMLGLPQVSVFHGTVDVSPDDPHLRTRLRILDRRTGHLVFVSRSLREYFESIAGPGLAGRSVVYNGIDLEAFRPGEEPAVRAELGAGPGELLLGAIGNVRPAKDYPTLLRAVAELVGRGVRCRCVIVGDTGGRPGEELVRLGSGLGLGDVVTFTGFRSDIDRVARALDVLVVSSSSEGFSLSTVQALASGTPVVATRSGGPEEILEEGAGGILVPAGSATALADGIERMCADPGLRRDLAMRGRRIVEERFSLRGMISAYERLYETLVPHPEGGTA